MLSLKLLYRTDKFARVFTNESAADMVHPHVSGVSRGEQTKYLRAPRGKVQANVTLHYCNVM